jgi:indole-3-glycerol phosphate synthase/phosphoribosylanthranilate isomerase
MDALVEVHDEGEMRRALALDSPLIGINNRDLRDLSIDLATTERLARMAPDRVLVTESGIRNREDVECLSRHVDALLVGSSLMAQDSPAQAARELVFGRVKLCGLRTGSDVDAARAASFAGFVFVPTSPRALSEQDAAPMSDRARAVGIGPVGVFRDAPMREVIRIARHTRLHAVQLHGSEDADYVRTLRRNLPGDIEIWTAVSVGRDALEGRGGDRLLFDNGEGGSGRAFDWAMVKSHAQLPASIVAGGIGLHNACAARALGSHAIDVGSAVDLQPGRKSPEKIAALFEALRPTCRQQMRACA